MVKDAGGRNADRSRPGATQRGPRFATLGALVVVAVAVAGLLVITSRHHETVGAPPAPAGAGSVTAAPSAPPIVRHPRGPAPPLTPQRLDVVRGHRLAPIRTPVKARRLVVVKPTTFEVASFDLLGASRTAAPGGYAPGAARMVGELRMMRSSDVTVAGLQEFQAPQVAAFGRLTHGSWAVYPGHGVATSIVWLTSEWTLVRAETRPFPYLHHTSARDPLVLLRENDSGREVWFLDVHNPAQVRGARAAGPNTPGARTAAVVRAAAVAREAAVARRLHHDGFPVVVTGDMNDRAPFACPFTRRSGMHSSDGWRSARGRCVRGDGPPNIDWILGSHEVRFAGAVPDFGSEDQHLSDHPLITAMATIAG